MKLLLRDPRLQRLVDMDKPTNNPETSPSLLLRVRDPDDHDSWKTFERVYGQIIRSYCVHWRLQPVDVDDVTQDVLSAVATGIRQFNYDPQKGRFRAWLGTVTANKIKRFLSRQSERREQPLPNGIDAPEHDEVYVEPDSNWVDLFSEQILAEACRIVRPEFEPNTWQCFESTWIEKEAPVDVASKLGIAVHAVYVNKSRVLKRLEAEISNLADDIAFG